ncbi:uncharacterized protein KGF55_000691 [Candida pseudojiufengensis]|uniref:uncharacterized protein n=1 Tax=Candida pseudojiufengensis TaxID=497109 RepID=UPI0022249B0A|nr:uncharacterized protein KGF55_000691 [Candida pseudojiufengensis]KAI5966382.1 hypothetical protein KGF55_000691 [Candida pseudojiufengensis]
MNSIYSSSATNSSISLEDYKDQLISQHQNHINIYNTEQQNSINKILNSFSSTSKSDSNFENAPLLTENQSPNFIQSPTFENNKTPVFNNYEFTSDYDTPKQDNLSNYTSNTDSKSSDDPFKSPTSINGLNLSSRSNSVRRKPPPDLVYEETKDKAKEPTALEESTILTSKMKRMSINNFGNLSSKFNSFKRSTSSKLLSPEKSPKPDQHKYKIEEDVIQHSQNQSPVLDPFTQITPPESLDYPTQQNPPPFWKYHILKFGKDLYLTTNPGSKHVLCRNGPGFYIEVSNNSDKENSKINSIDGYTLIFKDSNSIDQSITNKSFMKITKKSKKDGGQFIFSIPKDKFINEEGNIEKYEDLTIFNGFTFQSPINDEFFPYENLRMNSSQYFKNYEIKDLKGNSWNVGSIPRVRISKINQMRGKLKRSNSSNNVQDEEYKLINKRNIYFHQNYINSRKHCKYKESNPKSIYLNDSKLFPPVLSMFRPFENRVKKSFIQMAKNQQDQFSKKTSITYNNNNNDDFISNNQSIDDPPTKYFNGSDGLYYSKNTQDDLPDENKLGWITIYEDNEIFKGQENRGMFDIVLGMTLAVGFDSILNPNVPFTGYKVEYQFNLRRGRKGTYHLIYCNDNKLIYDMNLNDTIPWTKPVFFANNNQVSSLSTKENLIMARRKTFALRQIPIFLPNTLVGSINFLQSNLGSNETVYTSSSIHNSFKSMPLLASNILRNWCETNYKLNLIYHVPILTTPNIDSRFYEFHINNKNNLFKAQGLKTSIDNGWNKFISLSENYNFEKFDSRNVTRQKFDLVLNKINEIIDKEFKFLKLFKKKLKINQNLNNLYLNLILISKFISHFKFHKLMAKIDQILSTAQ